MTRQDVADEMRVSIENLRRLRLRDPRFPAPIKVGARGVRFKRSEVDAYLAQLEED
jgi:predicted DNA-binding transcriptional regulator AlpA